MVGEEVVAKPPAKKLQTPPERLQGTSELLRYR
jgi:hypothetical protein